MREFSLEFAPPENAVDFETWCCVLVAEYWQCARLSKYAGPGRKQYGVDLFVKTDNEVWAVQCKLRHPLSSKALGRQAVRKEVADALRFNRIRGFKNKLRRYAIATTAKRSPEIQQLVEQISARNESKGQFRIEVIFWDDLKELINCNPKLKDAYCGIEAKTIDDCLDRGYLRPPAERALMPSELLSAKYGVVAFSGRDAELRDFEQWLRSDTSRPIRILSGDGGIGKTRLMYEVIARAAEQGWVAGFLRREDPHALVTGYLKRLIVIDYAEGREVFLADLLERLRRQYEQPSTFYSDIRLVLVCRPHTDLPKLMAPHQIARNVLEQNRETIHLGAVAPTLRSQLILTAQNSFAQHVSGKPAAVPQASEDSLGIPDDRFLYLHVLALLSFFPEQQHSRPLGRTELLEGVLRLEEEHWRHALPVVLPREPSDRVFSLVRRALTWAAFADTIPVDEDLELFLESTQRSSDADSARLAVGVLSACYARDAEGHEPEMRFLHALEPDLLSEHLVSVVLNRDTSFARVITRLQGEPLERAARSIKRVVADNELLPSGFAALTASDLAKALAGTWDSLALVDLLDQHGDDAASRFLEGADDLQLTCRVMTHDDFEELKPQTQAFTVGHILKNRQRLHDRLPQGVQADEHPLVPLALSWRGRTCEDRAAGIQDIEEALKIWHRWMKEPLATDSHPLTIAPFGAGGPSLPDQGALREFADHLSLIWFSHPAYWKEWCAFSFAELVHADASRLHSLLPDLMTAVKEASISRIPSLSSIFSGSGHNVFDEQAARLLGVAYRRTLELTANHGAHFEIGFAVVHRVLERSLAGETQSLAGLCESLEGMQRSLQQDADLGEESGPELWPYRVRARCCEIMLCLAADAMSKSNEPLAIKSVRRAIRFSPPRPKQGTEELDLKRARSQLLRHYVRVDRQSTRALEQVASLLQVLTRMPKEDLETATICGLRILEDTSSGAAREPIVLLCWCSLAEAMVKEVGQYGLALDTVSQVRQLAIEQVRSLKRNDPTRVTGRFSKGFPLVAYRIDYLTASLKLEMGEYKVARDISDSLRSLVGIPNGAIKNLPALGDESYAAIALSVLLLQAQVSYVLDETQEALALVSVIEHAADTMVRGCDSSEVRNDAEEFDRQRRSPLWWRANALILRAMCEQSLRNHDAALLAIEEAGELAEDAMGEQKTRDDRELLASCMTTHAHVLIECEGSSGLRNAVDVALRSCEIWQELHELRPVYADRLSWARETYARALFVSEDHALSLRELERAIALLHDECRERPARFERTASRLADAYLSACQACGQGVDEDLLSGIHIPQAP